MEGGYVLYRYVLNIIALLLISSSIDFTKVSAEEVLSKEETYQLRMNQYLQYHHIYSSWYYLAAIDQYERNIQEVRQDIPKRDGLIAIQFSNEFWAGIQNPDQNDTSPYSIKYFNGMGLDGNGDGLADITDDEDVLFTMVHYLYDYGLSEDDFKLALWEYYRNETTVKQIMSIAKIYEKYDTLNVDKHTFPLDIKYRYSFIGTWGANRGWGGRRSHEGTDIYADYSTPVLSASYGVIEVLGWNKFGGWRIGIRDNHNSYHYYAHLASFAKNIKEGDIVEAGQVIGYVGSTGYGKEGTSGKFPPHLHYGIYKFNGRTEWAFDPYPSLLRWEKEAKAAKK